MGGPWLIQALVLENAEISAGTRLLKLNAPEMAGEARPGRFVMVETGGGTLLKRPFSIHRFTGDGQLWLLYRVVGLGTEQLSRVGPGAALEILGPLGRGFRLEDAAAPVHLVAGGMGAAPMLALIEALGPDMEMTFYYGESSAERLLPPEHLDLFRPARIEIVTEDGRVGKPGLVTGPLIEALAERPGSVFACGPRPMLAAVAAAAAAAGAPAQTSLEAHMACGLGACLGCVVEDSAGGYRRVCLEGPVFEAGEIKWNPRK